MVVPNSLIPTADDQQLNPYERRHPELEVAVAGVSGVDAYSMEQAQQIERFAPILFCTLPEFYLAEATSQYIPKDFLEDDGSYDVRKTRAPSSFEPFYTHLRNLVVGTALRKGVALPSNIDPAWGNFFQDCDLEGHSITSFCKELFPSSIDKGVAGLWVEYPKLPADLSAEEERLINPRPYFVHIKAENVLECRNAIFTLKIGDEQVFGSFPVYLRIKSEIRRPKADNEFFEEVVPTVLVYDMPYIQSEEVNATPFYMAVDEGRSKVRCRTFVKDDMSGNTDTYTQYGEDSYLSIPFIPFVPIFGGEKEAFFRARPLLLDIARLNLHHWAVSADLAESIHLNASPIPWATGVRPNDEIKSGGGRMLSSESPDARFGMMSAPMDGANATISNLQRLEKSMERLAAVAMTTGKTQAESGFAKLLDRSQSDSQLAVLVQSLEDGINRALLYASAYRKYQPVKISISKNFIPVKLHSQQVMALIQLWREGIITIGLFLKMLDAGEMFEGIPDFEVEEMLESMGLTGEETAKVMGLGIFASTGRPGGGPGVSVDNTSPLSEGSDRESMEASVEPTES